MKKLLLTAILHFFCFSTYGQQIPIDFSENQDIFIGFGGSSFSYRIDNPSSSVNRGGQFFNNGSDPLQGFYIDLAVPIVLTNDNKVFTLRFYSFDPNNHNILLKLEDNTNTDVQVKTTFSVPSPSNWTTVSFDFSNAQNSSDGSTVNASGSYSRMVLFIDEGTSTAGTYVIDDITNGDAATPPTNPNDIDVFYDVLVWSDEFNDTNGPINTNKWFHQTQIPAGGNWYNGEQQHYTNRIENSKIENGNLFITAKNEVFEDQGYTKQYTSARLNSKFAFRYGRVDVKAKLPFGNGTWPAIWTLGKNINEAGAYWQTQGFATTNWPATGEIDIMEHGLHSLNEVSVALHTPSSSGNTMNTETNQLTDVANTYHVYSINWSPEKIVFLIDNVGFYTYNPTTKNSSTWPFDEEQYLLLNIAMGGFSGTIDSNFSESSMVIDYVRVFQNNALSLEENNKDLFLVYPNPSSKSFNIKTDLQISKIKLYDILGKLILSKEENTNVIDVQNLKTGLYILNIEANTTIVTKKVFIN